MFIVMLGLLSKIKVLKQFGSPYKIVEVGKVRGFRDFETLQVAIRATNLLSFSQKLHNNCRGLQ